MVWESIITTAITSAVIWGAVVWYLKRKIVRLEKKDDERILNRNTVMEQMLSLWSSKLLGKHYEKEWIEKMADVSRSFCYWATDEVLLEFSKFIKAKSPEYKQNLKDYETHFGNTILAFRKELGYKNKGEAITAEDIIVIFKSGFKKEL